MAQEATTMALPKFEDWKRPWQDGEFDAEKAAKLIYNLHVDKEKLSEARDAAVSDKDKVTKDLEKAQAKVTEFEEKDLSEAEKLRRENERLKAAKDAPATTPSGDADLRADRLEIALEKGLTKAQAARLVGKTRAELEADADAYIEEHNLAGSGENGGKGGQAPPSQRPQVRTGSKQRAQDAAGDDENIDDPGAYYDKIHGKA